MSSSSDCPFCHQEVVKAHLSCAGEYAYRFIIKYGKVAAAVRFRQEYESAPPSGEFRAPIIGRHLNRLFFRLGPEHWRQNCDLIGLLVAGLERAMGRQIVWQVKVTD